MNKITLKKQIQKEERLAKKAIKCEVKKTRHRLAAILSALLAATQLFAGTAFTDPNNSYLNKLPDSSEIISITNAERAKNQLPALKDNAVLNAAAAAKLKDMQSKGYWDHVSPDGQQPWDFISNNGYNYSFAGENLAKGFVSADSVVSAWMNSESHRANILNKNYQDIGLASGVVVINNQRATVTVEMFGKVKATPAESSFFAPSVLAASNEASVNILNPVSDNRVVYFVLWAALFVLIVFDGIVLRRCGLHKSRKHMFEFRSALLVNCIAFLLLFVNVAAII